MAGLTDQQLAALDVMIDSLAADRASALGVAAGFTEDILHVVQAVCPALDAIGEGAAAARVADLQAALPAEPLTLEQLVALRSVHR